MINGEITLWDKNTITSISFNHREDRRFLNSLVEIFKFQFSFAFLAKEMHQQGCLCFLIHMLSEGTKIAALSLLKASNVHLRCDHNN